MPIDNNLKNKIKEFNSSYKAPSFGPINMLAVALSARDIIMYLGKVDGIKCRNKRIGIYPSLEVKEQIFWHN